MPIEVKKKERETTGALLRRFSQRVKQSGVLLQAKNIRFHIPKKSKRAIRASALRRGQIQSARAQLEKMGLITEEIGVRGRRDNKWKRLIKGLKKD